LMMYRTAQTRAAEDESTRLFYVATTRAADYLILSSAIKDPAEPSQAWTRLLAERFDLQSGICIAPAPGITPPQVRVSTTEPPEPEKAALPRGKKWRDILADLPTEEVDTKQLAAEELRLSPVPPNRQARRRFSISRLTSELKAVDATAGAPAEDQNAPNLPGGGSLGLSGNWEEPEKKQQCRRGAVGHPDACGSFQIIPDALPEAGSVIVATLDRRCLGPAQC
jgi:ATP-dependent exoDNAse (exonuclease V) beta subunit